MSIKLGDKVSRKIHVDSNGATVEHGPYTGTVTYIHPKGRYFMAVFQLKGGAVRECYPLAWVCPQCKNSYKKLTNKTEVKK